MTDRKRFTEQERSRIYDRTRGKCHICHKRLSFFNYGLFGQRGAWHVEHSRALAVGGSHHGNNLYAACITCNLDKGIASSRTARARAGVRRSPLRPREYEKCKSDNIVIGAGLFGTLGAALGGPAGAILGTLLGAALGESSDPDA